MGKSKKVILAMGLPGSGKSTFANQLLNRENYKYDILDLDLQIKKEKKYHPNYDDDKILINILNRYFGSFSSKNFIIDGLLLNNNDIIKIIKMVSKIEEKCEYEIHFWKLDRESCLWNDKYRREKNSEITIKNAVLEKPNFELIKKETGFDVKIIEHEVQRKPLYKVFAEKNNLFLKDDRYFRSDSWSLGGTWGSYTGNKGRVSPGEPLTCFEDFDNLLEKICPNITFMQYKKIYNECVETDTYSEGDYYGGCVEYAYFKCDMSVLFKELLERGLIKEEDI